MDPKICLVIPPSIFLLDDRVFMTLGLLKIAAVLEGAGYRVDLLDLSGVSNFLDVVQDYARAAQASLYGITATTPQLPAATKIAQTIRESQANSQIILGGPHITLVNAAYKREEKLGIEGRAHVAMKQVEQHFDVLVAGDGEDAIFEACQPGACGSLIDADDPKSPLFLTNKRLEELPLPARHLVDIESYRYSIDGVPALSMIAQLGCPFECGFCGGRQSPMLRRVRTRSSESIVEEMVHLYRTTGRRGFMLYDDELNVNKKIVELMQLIAETQKKLGVEWRLRGFIKAELFTDEQARVMHDAGFRWILTGFESGSPEILRAINKKATREENTRCVEIAKRHGLKVKALMSIGHPGESLETARDTERWLLEVKPDDFDVTIITTYPGTPYYDYAVKGEEAGSWIYTYPKTGARLYQREVDYTQVADYYKGDPNGGYKAYVHTDHLSEDELVAERDRIERSVRAVLGIRFNPGAPGVQYEHSMGQHGLIPTNILRSSR